MAFYKFPRTEHLGSNSEIVDDDRSIPADAFFALFLNPAVQPADGTLRLVVQEKVDGANVGVHFEQEYDPIVQKRSGVIGAGEQRQFNVFRDWVFEHVEELWQVLGTEYCLFGEWLWTQHAVTYNALPSYFVGFDILDKATGKFLSTLRTNDMMAQCAVAPVPQLLDASLAELEANATYKPHCRSADGLEKLVASLIKRSRFGTEQAEGVYIRIEDLNHVVARVKLRRNTFVSGRADFHRGNGNNSLAQQ
jgi:hypothetical protein